MVFSEKKTNRRWLIAYLHFLIKMTPNTANYDINSDLEQLWKYELIRTYDGDTERFCTSYLGPFLCDSSPYFRAVLTPKAEQFLKKHQTPKIKRICFNRIKDINQNLFIYNLIPIIMADQKITMPSGMGGIVRYYEDSTSKIVFSPSLVVVFIILVMILELVLHYAL